jgi:hypothetical protein
MQPNAGRAAERRTVKGQHRTLGTQRRRTAYCEMGPQTRNPDRYESKATSARHARCDRVTMGAMTFSIRNLLALVVVAALGIVAWRSHQDAQREQDRLTKLLTEIKSAEQRLSLDNPPLHQAMLITRDEYEAIRKLRKHCDANIELLREKYGSIEPRGPDVLSIRNLPSIRGDTGQTPVALRVYTPKERKVWIKYGVHNNMNSIPASPDFESGLLRQSPFDHVGPYEKRLSPGQHVLSMTIGDASAGSLPFRITLDSRILIDSAFKSASHTGGGVIGSTPQAMQQMNFKDGKLHWGGLISARMTLRDDEGNNPPKSFKFLVWLSDETSGLSSFPGSQ